MCCRASNGIIEELSMSSGKARWFPSDSHITLLINNNIKASWSSCMYYAKKGIKISLNNLPNINESDLILG